MRMILNKLRRSNGFTLAETLIAILILLMVSAIVAGAIPVASNVYTKTVDAANAQVLLSTAVTVLRDEMGTATDIHTYAGTDKTSASIVYRSGKTGNWSRLYLKDGVLMQDYYPNDEEYDILDKAPGPEYEDWGETRELISTEAATKGLKLSFKFSMGDGYISFTNLTVKKQKVEGDTEDKWSALTDPQDLSVRILKK